MALTTMIRTFTELNCLKSFDERYSYLRLNGIVGESTFGFDRHLNQMLYSSKKWLAVRDKVIIRDDGYDLGMVGYEIYGHIYVHHMNPISIEDIEENNDDIFNPEYLISTSRKTHLAIHYGDESLLPKLPVIRRPGDTCPWR